MPRSESLRKKIAAAGGVARAKALSESRRTEIARAGQRAMRENAAKKAQETATSTSEPTAA